MTDAGRSVPKAPPSRDIVAERPRIVLFLATVILLIGGATVGYYLGKKLASRPLALAVERVQQLQPENQRLKKTVVDQNVEIAGLQAKFAELQAKLHAMMPVDGTFNLSPNQSIVVAHGRLTLGLVGPPNNSSINININGKQQAAVPGDVIKVTSSAGTACEVRVQSFDMFKAVVTATCKP